MFLGKLKCPLPPDLDTSTQLLVLNIVKLKLRSSEPPESIHHLGKHCGLEPSVLLAREFEQPVKTESIFKSPQVHEVPSLCPAEHREQLVSGQLFCRQDLKAWTLIRWKESGVAGQIHLCPIVVIADHKARKTGPFLHPLDLQARFSKSLFG